ncbi:hypothetical protein A5865_001134, partial [Enterococcus sp. 12E11_DIV0728]
MVVEGICYSNYFCRFYYLSNFFLTSSVISSTF